MTKRVKPVSSIMAVPRHLASTRPGGDPGLDPLELGDPARYGDPTLVLKPVLVLCLPQKLAEQGMVKVDHGDQNPHKVPVFLAHVDRQVAFRNRRLLLLKRVLTQRNITRPGLRPAQRFGSSRQAPTPVEDFRDGL